MPAVQLKPLRDHRQSPRIASPENKTVDKCFMRFISLIKSSSGNHESFPLHPNFATHKNAVIFHKTFVSLPPFLSWHPFACWRRSLRCNLKCTYISWKMISGYKNKRKWNWKLLVSWRRKGWRFGGSSEGNVTASGLSDFLKKSFSRNLHLTRAFKELQIKPRFAAVLTSKDVDDGRKNCIGVKGKSLRGGNSIKMRKGCVSFFNELHFVRCSFAKNYRDCKHFISKLDFKTKRYF